MIGITGPHRSGKSTLAKAIADQYSFSFIDTSTSVVFKELGLDPSKTYDFTTRLMVQRAILDHLRKAYAVEVGENDTDVITDRTPIDMLAYTYAEVNGNNLSDKDTEALLEYTEECIELTNRRFSLIVALQPGIAYVPAPGKGASNPAYIEHLNALIMGCVADERIKVKTAYIPRAVLGIQERIDAVWKLYVRNYRNQAEETASIVTH